MAGAWRESFGATVPGVEKRLEQDRTMDDETIRQTRQYFDAQMTTPELMRIAGGLACVFSSRCPGKETPNEDAAAIIPLGNQSAVLVVADGLGGGAAGDLAARRGIEALQSAIHEADIGLGPVGGECEGV